MFFYSILTHLPSFFPADALLISVAPDSSSDYTSTYLQTAQLIAKEAPKISSLKHILYTSSLSVYGDHQGNWVIKHSPAPANENAKILLETEKTLLNCSTNNLKVCVNGEIYGPGREIENRLKRMIHSPFQAQGDPYQPHPSA